ncbi:MAG TPA: carboxymuconolactone decarboxylase family protein [Gemmatimonadaceae bacterium]
MTLTGHPTDILEGLDTPTSELVSLAVTIATGSEQAMRAGMAHAVEVALNPDWVEELILQSYLFAGFPRALNAAREWRRASGRPAPGDAESADPERLRHWTARGERTCATVYGEMYARLRANIRDLHPALDTWMIVDGYGKVLGRPGLDLRRRELCIVAVCAALAQERQLHAHLHGALNAGAGVEEIHGALEIGAREIDPEARRRAFHLWARVRD